MDILIFQTNTENVKQKRKLFPLLRMVPGIIRWTIDLEDTDRILRVEAVQVSPAMIEQTLQHGGFYCRELED